MFSLCTIHEIDYKDEQNDALYQLIKNDFTDEEFEKIACEICKNENLFGKYPKPFLFYRNKPKSKDVKKAKMVQAFTAFWEKLSSELNKKVTHWRGEGLSELGTLTLSAFGGLTHIYMQVNRHDEYSKSIIALKREMETFFYDNYTADKVMQLQENTKELELTKNIGVIDG